MSKFQLIVLSIFVICIVAATAVFALSKSSATTTTVTTITIWGTLPSDSFDQFVARINSGLQTAVTVTYKQLPEADFNQNFVQAVARGQGPDAILIPQDMLLVNLPELAIIPYTLLPQRTFLDTYVSEASLYLRSDGITALPFSIDPLVMYWNRDTFNNAGIASVGTADTPITWSKLTGFNAKLTQKDVNANIQKSLVSLGEFANVDHARDILSALFLQSGNTITALTSNDTVTTVLGSGQGQSTGSVANAVTFYGSFANPSNQNYSWNRSLPNSQAFFLSGNLATYFGFASELASLREKNPNLNFDVAPFPQPVNQKTNTTYARMYGFSLVKNAPNPTASYTILQNFLTPDAVSSWATLNNLPPVRRDLIAQGTTDPYITLFDNSALISKGWLDPNAANTTTIFKTMIESISSGAATPSTALQTANDQLSFSLRNI